jgi:hypothetical protein
MANETSSNIVKRIIFMGFVLGMMVALGMVLILMAINRKEVSLIAVVLPLFVIAIPMTRSLNRLRQTVEQ